MGGMFKTPKVATPEVAEMAVTDDASVQKAKKAALTKRSAASGRSSTMLSQYGQSDKLGG